MAKALEAPFIPIKAAKWQMKPKNFDFLGVK